MSDEVNLTGAAAGRAAYMLIRRGKASIADVVHKLDIRARILRDIAPVVAVSGPGLPALRGMNLECAADELETAAELLRCYGGVMPRTAQDYFNSGTIINLVLALRIIRDEAGSNAGPIAGIKDHSWCAGVAMSALASVDPMLPVDLREASEG